MILISEYGSSENYSSLFIIKAINFKVIVLGAQGVGKSSLITRYIKGEFSEGYNVTVGVEFSSKIIKIQSQSFIRFQVWDTAGQQFFRALVRSFYKGIVAVFFVFAVDRQSSLKELQAWVQEVRENADQEVVYFLIGSRADIQNKREVSPMQAAEFLKRINGAYFIQTSAKTGKNIEDLFEKAANILYKKYKTNPQFAKLVQPFQSQNFKGPAVDKKERGRSIVLRRETVRGLTKKTSQGRKCCQ